jgi:enterochelin esterase-like enzyme
MFFIHIIRRFVIFSYVLILLGCDKEGGVVICEGDKAVDHINDTTWVTEEVKADNITQEFFYSPETRARVSFHLFLPDSYGQDTTRYYPVIYWLHGSGGGIEGIIALRNYYHMAMGLKHMPEAIVVFPYGLPLGMWCDSKDGLQKVEGMFIKDLIPFVESKFRIKKNTFSRLVEGFSMGGYGAGRFGFKYPEIFGTFSMLGAGPVQTDFSVVAPQNQHIQPIIFDKVYGNDADYFFKQSPWFLSQAYASAGYPDHHFRIGVGTEDFVYRDNVILHQHLNHLQIKHDYFELDGLGHVPGAVLQALKMRDPSFYHKALR